MKMPFLDKIAVPLLSKPQKPKVDFNALIAFCVHRGIDPDTWDSMTYLTMCPNPRMLVKIKAGDALIDRSRSIVASRFLENKDYEILFFIDDDIIFDPRDVVKVLRLVHDNNLDIVGGAYVKKQSQGTHFAIKTFEGDKYTFGDKGFCQETECVSTGFMAIHRRVLEKMAETLPLCHPGDMRFYPFFAPFAHKLDNGQWIYASEDWAFNIKARELGFKVHVDCTTKLGHAGKYIYTQEDMLRAPKPKLDNFTYIEENGVLKVNSTPIDGVSQEKHITI